MVKDTLTRDDLRAMEVGQAKEFVLPSVRKILSARSTVSSTGQVDGTRYRTRVDIERKAITVFRDK